ncbi:MAG TPA: hypothetical protein P5059_03740 [Candidatus Dojkabacteria bacterium]|nr:hypothetical protein [Candidatus Dojkabacteria bacterium]
MFNNIHTFVLSNPFLANLFNTFYSPVQKQLDKLKETLSENSYSNIEGLLDKISSISLILLSIYIVYSIFFFIYSFIFKHKIRIKVLISIAICLPLLLLCYAIYTYINI